MKWLHVFNLLGVLALAALCLAQWRQNRDLNLELNRREQARLDLMAEAAEQERIKAGLAADLAGFKQSFAQAQAEAGETREKLEAVNRAARQLTSERDQLKTSVTNWAAAVAARDERLKEAEAQIRRLAGELEASIRKFNELATNYNALAREMDALRVRSARPAAKP